MPSHLIDNPIDREYYHAEYWEDVEKLVDEFVEGIKDREYSTQNDVRRCLADAVNESCWVEENENWAIHTLLWSKHASAAICANSFPHPFDYVTGDSFPFRHFALAAMKADCMEKLRDHLEYQELPENGNCL